MNTDVSGLLKAFEAERLKSLQLKKEIGLSSSGIELLKMSDHRLYLHFQSKRKRLQGKIHCNEYQRHTLVLPRVPLVDNATYFRFLGFSNKYAQ